MRLWFLLMYSIVGLGLLYTESAIGEAAEWNPQAFAKEETLTLRTIGPEEGEYWFPVWLVVIDEQVYVRLGTRAADRIKKNKTAPILGVKIAGQQFDRVKAEEASDMAEAVAEAMSEKYWEDLVIRFFSHPLTLRLLPDDKK